jgi:hypothetical protein
MNKLDRTFSPQELSSIAKQKNDIQLPFNSNGKVGKYLDNWLDF